MIALKVLSQYTAKYKTRKLLGIILWFLDYRWLSTQAVTFGRMHTAQGPIRGRHHELHDSLRLFCPPAVSNLKYNIHTVIRGSISAKW